MTEQETVKTEEVAKVNPLERTLDLVVSYASAEELTEKALKNYGKNAKLPGFRKGHVPAAQVRRMYGMQAYDEAINQLVGEAWQKAASESELRIAGYPRIDAAKNEEDKENMHFTAKFEVFPDVQVPDFSAVELKRYVCPVTDAEVEKTIDVMRRQRATYNVVERAAANDDRVKLNFKGKKDGVEFQGGSAEGYVFVLGQGRMLPEFETAATGMTAGEKKTFTLTFPENYGNKELAGKAAQFDLECVKVEAPHYPEVNDEFAKQLAVESVDALKSEIRSNIEREVQERLYERNRTEAFSAAVEVFNYQAPAAIVHSEQERLRENFEQMVYGMNAKKNKERAPLELFAEPAKKQARIGMMLTAVIDQNKIEATDDDIKARAALLAAAYEQPEEVLEDLVKTQREHLAARVLEEKALEFLFSKAKTTEETLTFEQLSGMGQQ